MQKSYKRIISLLLCMCMSMGLLPVKPAAALTMADTATDYVEIRADEEIPSDFSGLVLTYEDNNGIISITTSVHNVSSFSAGALFLAYDPAVVDLATSTGGTATAAKAFEIGTVPGSIISETGAANGIVADETPLLDPDEGPLRLQYKNNRDTVNTKLNGAPIKFFNFQWVPTPTVADTTVVDYYNAFTLYQSSYNIALPTDTVLLKNYFKVKAGAEVTDTTFGLESDGTYPQGGGLKMADTSFASQSILFRGFPEPPESYGEAKVTVKAGDTPLPDATVTVTGESDGGTVVTGEGYATATTDENGVATFNLPYGTYKFTVANTPYDTKIYQMDATSLANGVSLVVKAETGNTAEYANMEEVRFSYEIPVKVFDATEAAVALPDPATNIKLNGTGAIADAGTGEAKVSLSSVSSNMPLLVDIPGYQKVGAGQASITAMLSGDKIGSLDTGEMNNPLATVTVEGGDVIANKYVKIVLKKVVTKVTIPLPVPKVGETPISVQQAKGLTVTLKPIKGSSAALLAELGASGMIELTAAKNDIIVDGAATMADTAADAAASSIKIIAPVPDGAYDMEITGAGFEPVKTQLTVFKAGEKTVANVGGKATLGADGAIESLSGGVSKSEAATVDPETGNSAIALDANVKQDADVTVSDGSFTNGTDVSGGILDSSLAQPNGELDIKVVTDPIYLVKVVKAASSQENKPVYEAQVYLKNAKASAGTFGLYFDPKIFAPDAAFNTTVKLNPAVNIEASEAPATQIHAPATGAGEPGYVFFQWMVKAANAAVVDASAGEVLLATITLPVINDSTVVGNLSTLFDKRAIYTMDYAQTAGGLEILKTVNEVFPDKDDPEYNAILNDMMSSIWRTTDMSGPDGAIVLTDASKATRGGFYQITVNNSDKVAVNSDIRMQFELPSIATRLRADFHVVDKAGADISGADIAIYAKPTEGEFDIKTATPITGGTLKTDKTGHAAVALDAGTYYYTVKHDSFWDYPDGTVGTDTDNKDYDTFEIGEEKLITSGNNAAGGQANTAIVGEYITPVMDARSYHKVSLSMVKKGTSTAADKTTAQLSGTASAFNDVDFTFSLTPIAGYEWAAGYANDMTKVATVLSAKLYGTNNAPTTSETDMYQAGTATEPEIKWDDSVKKFRIAGTNIKGDKVGDVTFADGAKPEWYEALRAGDLVIVAPGDLFTPADMTLTVTPGAGGKVSAVEDDTLKLADIEVKVGGVKQDTAMPVNATASVVEETLKNGRTTSSVYTFTPDNDNIIDRVIINGVNIPLNDAQKKAPYTYQFLNVSGDESITVTFAKKDGTALSDPVVTLTLGADGGATAIAYTKPDDTQVTDDTLAGPASKTYVAKADQEFDVTLKANDGYQLDTVLVDGEAVALDSAKDEATNFYTKELTISLKGTEAGKKMEAGESRPIVVTFKKAAENAVSTQAIVVSSIKEGLGTISPVGTTIHTVGDTPTFTIVPKNNWELPEEKAILVGGVDKTEHVAKADTGVYSYTTEALPAGETAIVAALAEKRFEVKGTIKTQYGGSNTKEKVTLLFTRDEILGHTTKQELTYETDTFVNDSGNMSFGFFVPAGEWEVKVKKAGYLDYIISGFEISDEATYTIYFGDGTNGTVNGKTMNDIVPIELVPGDAFGEGRAIASNDIGTISMGWVKDAGEINIKKADVNENGAVTSDDMSLATGNYLKMRVRKTYTEFCPAEPVTSPEEPAT